MGQTCTGTIQQWGQRGTLAPSLQGFVAGWAADPELAEEGWWKTGPLAAAALPPPPRGRPGPFSLALTGTLQWGFPALILCRLRSRGLPQTASPPWATTPALAAEGGGLMEPRQGSVQVGPIPQCLVAAHSPISQCCPETPWGQRQMKWPGEYSACQQRPPLRHCCFGQTVGQTRNKRVSVSPSVAVEVLLSFRPAGVPHPHGRLWLVPYPQRS